MTEGSWWRGAVIYQIYPRSFADANADGIGDLAGILSQLDYVRDLGVDAIWISPFFKSPQKDYGYDVADYRAVDPMFGDLAAADRLIAEAHGRGLKVLVDLVLSHTSDQHPWFQQSRRDRGNAKADWYVWADAKPDGTPPNNWLSIFGGSAWAWEPRRAQYFLHNFLVEQPDLNMHHPDVVPALLEEARFWLERGVDGFRLDAIDCAVHDPRLRDNPPRPEADRPPGGLVEIAPVSRQVQLYNKGLHDVAPLLLEPLRQLCDRYGDIVLLGELAGDRALENAAIYGAAGRGIHMAYTFDLLSTAYAPASIGGVVARVEAGIEDGWPCWSLSNHDVVRAVSRLGGAEPPESLRRQLPILLACLRGTVCLYQGEELGLEEADLGRDDLRDPYGIAFWPVFKGRDGCRTPMPWREDALNAGFSAGRPWLPVPDTHRRRAVDRQLAADGSTLNAVRRFLRWRSTQTALRAGRWRAVEAPAPLLVFERYTATERLVCGFNLSAADVDWTPAVAVRAVEAPLVEPARPDGAKVRFPAHGVLIARPVW